MPLRRGGRDRPARQTDFEVLQDVAHDDLKVVAGYRPLGPHLADSAYTVGLVSALDLLLHAPLTDIVGGLSLRAELEDALFGRTGPLGDVLADVLAREVGGESFAARSGTPPADVEWCYVQALAWANEVCGVLSLAPAPLQGVAG